MLYTMLTFVPPGSYRKGSLTKIKVIISFLLCLVMATANPMSTRTETNPPELESKVFNGVPAMGGYKYMASLQINGLHICGSSFFQKKYLLTTVLCAWYIGDRIIKNLDRATAVLGDVNLNNGQRVNILKIAYPTSPTSCGEPRIKKDNDAAVIMLSDKVDYTRVEILELFGDKLNIHLHKCYGKVCGWGSVTEDNDENTHIGNAGHSDILHCMTLEIRSIAICRQSILTGDFRRRLLCGRRIAKAMQITTLADVGSPLTKRMDVDNSTQNYIIGILLDRFVSSADTFLRFTRINAIIDDVGEMVTKLSSHKSAEAVTIHDF